MTPAVSASAPASRLLPWLIYPTTMGLVIAVYLGLSGTRVSLLVATYAAVFLGAGLVTFFEWLTPERSEWRADRGSIVNDFAFMVLVQMLLPKFLSFLAAVSLVQWLQTIGFGSEQLWVHSWPVPAQALLMLLLADFFRYWLHVACHRFPLFWRLHSVHHSPKKLYWLNVGRFHPLEKALQFFLDALPFILLGVGEQVLALYFVFYAVNGFFQHCNIRLRFGWLNYLISSAELHRWHHSRVIAESNSNYGNNVILWDLIFGTRFLPHGRTVEELGLLNREYPLDFASQIKTPFVEGIDHRHLPLGSWRDVFLNTLLGLHMLWIRWWIYAPIKRRARDPAQMQRWVLQRILGTHSRTQFGTGHRLSASMSIPEFRAAVKVHDYEVLRPYIERQDHTGELALNPVKPVMYAVTSGTSGAPKYLPVLPAMLRSLGRTQRLFSCVQFRHCPDGFRGKILGIAGSAVEGHMPSGTPYGSASGFLYKSMPRLARAKYVLPPEVFEISDYQLKYHTILRLALPHRDITYLGSANPSTFLRLLEILVSEHASLLEDIANGTFCRLEEIPREFRPAIAARCRANPSRAVELQSILSGKAEPALQSIWPYLRIVATWTGGSCGIPLAALKRRLPEQICLVDLGYLSSELRVTVTIHPHSNAGLPTFWENFFEFVERDTWERGEPEFLTLDQLKLGRAYYIFVTTPGGLFRYAMNDIVEVAGRFHQTPTLRFLQKGAGCTSITGEKLYESQILAAVKTLEEQFGFTARFLQVLADESSAAYTLYLEVDAATAPGESELAAAFDHELARVNVEFQAKRESGRLQAPSVILLRPGTFELVKAASGLREAQFKTVALRYRRDFPFDLESHAASAPLLRP